MPGQGGDFSGPDSEVSGRRFKELSEGCKSRALQFVRMKLGAFLRRRVDSEDVLQEVLLEASQLFPDQEGSGMGEREFLLWIESIAEYKINNLTRFHVDARRRSVKREERLRSDAPAHRTAGDGKTPSRIAMDFEMAERIQEALSRLTPREREVIILVHQQKLRVSEAARRMGKTANATSVLLHQAHRRLAEILDSLKG